jgi:hypothetical protein
VNGNKENLQKHWESEKSNFCGIETQNILEIVLGKKGNSKEY